MANLLAMSINAEQNMYPDTATMLRLVEGDDDDDDDDDEEEEDKEEVA